MANWSTLKAAVANIIKTNGNQAITGQLLQNVLNNIITNVGENSTFAGIATTSTNPGAPDGPVFYLAATAGTYANFSGIEVLEGEAVILQWGNGTWTKKASGFSTEEKLSYVSSKVIGAQIINFIDGDYRSYSAKKCIDNIGFIIVTDPDLLKFRLSVVVDGKEGDYTYNKRIILLAENGYNITKDNAEGIVDLDGRGLFYYDWSKHTTNYNAGSFQNAKIAILNTSSSEVYRRLKELIDANYISISDIQKTLLRVDSVQSKGLYLLEGATDAHKQALDNFKFLIIDEEYSQSRVLVVYDGDGYNKRIIIRDKNGNQITKDNAEGIVDLDGHGILWYDWSKHNVNLNTGYDGGKIAISNTPLYSLYDLIKESQYNIEYCKMRTTSIDIPFTNGYYDANGNIGYYGNYGHTRMIEVNSDEVIYMSSDLSLNTGGAARHCFFDANKNFLGAFSSQEISDATVVVADFPYSDSVRYIAFTTTNRYEAFSIRIAALSENDISTTLSKIANNYYTAVKTGEPLPVFETKPGGYLTSNTPPGVGYLGTEYEETFLLKSVAVEAGKTYILYSKSHALASNEGFYAAAFSTKPLSVSEVTEEGLFKATTAQKSVEYSYTALKNGYIIIAEIANKGVIDVYDAIEKSRVDDLDERVEVLEQSTNRKASLLENKTLAILGDSIMMLMRDNFSKNSVTYLGSDGNTYQPSEVSAKSDGTICVTISPSIICEVVNSNQNGLDDQNWSRVKDALSLKSLVNLGLGGATYMERSTITAYPYPDNNAGNNIITTSIPNEVRWLKRLVDEGKKEEPNAILIWAGTNDSGQTNLSNYDDIMAMDWETLSDDVLGMSARKTVLGGARFSIEYLMRNFPNATIFIAAPIQSRYSTNKEYDKGNLKNTVAAIKKMSDRYSCIFLDAFHEIGICDLFEEINGDSSTTETWLYDGLHPNGKGKILYANYLVQRLSTLFFSKV